MHKRKIRMLTVAGGLLASVILFGSSAEAGPSAAMLANTCAGCHGTYGISGGPAMPTIAGMPADYLKTIMADFKSGERPSTIMGRLAQGYSEKEIALIADFFAKQKWQNAKSAVQSKQVTQVDARLAKKGAKLIKKRKCDMCHEDGGTYQDEDTPRMAGQWLDYLLFKMHDFKNPDMTIPQPKKMKRQIKKMSVQELEATAHFYANQK